LTFCADFPRIAQRFEAWWQGELLDRPIFLASANPNPARPITRRMELLDDLEAWYAAKLADLRQLHRVGDLLPSIRADLGPVLLGSLLGGARVFAADTAWTERFINDDWSNVDWALRADNPWWQRMVALTERVAADAAGRYLVMSPGLGGTGEALLNLRGATELSLDVADRPETIRAAVDAIFPVWRAAFTELYRIAARHNAGLIHWLNLWSDRPYLLAECDFATMIGKRAFETLFLPDIARQAAAAGRAVFHLDGPGATRHIGALLTTPEIQAIQYSPGAGTPSALAWVPMFRRIQAAGRSLLVICPADEVLALCDALRPEGLAVWVDTPLPVAELDALFERFCRRRLSTK
jgi:hypothetical protein